MEYYIFEADRIGCTIIDILTRKAHQGVVVRLLIDGYGSRRMPHAMLARLLAAGVKVQRNTCSLQVLKCNATLFLATAATTVRWPS